MRNKPYTTLVRVNRTRNIFYYQKESQDNARRPCLGVLCTDVITRLTSLHQELVSIVRRLTALRC